jgi:hypothetical protein
VSTVMVDNCRPLSHTPSVRADTNAVPEPASITTPNRVESPLVTWEFDLGAVTPCALAQCRAGEEPISPIRGDAAWGVLSAGT